MNNSILVTGSAGFIGFHLCRKLLENEWEVISLDNINDYYDVQLKLNRLSILKEYPKFKFHKIDLADRAKLQTMFNEEDMDNVPVVHLAAQAGVRYAQINPGSYINSNITGFFNLLELVRQRNCPHFLYASSSSVYGGNTKLPFSVHDNIDHPVSLYAATKKSNELMAHVYSYTYELPTTGLRFFTVYGPWGRPDMALFLFVEAILKGESLPVFNYGDMSRDFTYIDDIIECVYKLIGRVPKPDPDWNSDAPDPATSWKAYRIYNVGHQEPVNLLNFIHTIEDAMGKKANLDLRPMQLGDVKDTFADIDSLIDEIGFIPKTSIKEGVEKFLDWYSSYYGIKL